MPTESTYQNIKVINSNNAPEKCDVRAGTEQSLFCQYENEEKTFMSSRVETNCINVNEVLSKYLQKGLA